MPAPLFMFNHAEFPNSAGACSAYGAYGRADRFCLLVPVWNGVE